MAKPLIIVESPTKIKTLTKYIGKDYNVAASAGHIRDLPVKTLGINIEDNFKAEYVNITNKAKVIANLKKIAKGADKVILLLILIAREKPLHFISWISSRKRAVCFTGYLSMS